MDVRFVSDDGIQQHPVGELERLLARDHGFVWVDIPVCDEEAARVLSEVFGFHPWPSKPASSAMPCPRSAPTMTTSSSSSTLLSSARVAMSTTSSWTSSSVLALWSPSTAQSTRRSRPRPRCARPARCWGGSRRGGCAPDRRLSCPMRSSRPWRKARRRLLRRSHARCGRWSSGSPRATWATPSSSWKTCSAPGMACWRCPTWPPWATRSTSGCRRWAASSR